MPIAPDAGHVDRPSTDQAPTKLSPTEQEALHELIAALGSDTLSASQLMERMGLVHRPHFRQFYLVPALESSVEPTKPEAAEVVEIKLTTYNPKKFGHAPVSLNPKVSIKVGIRRPTPN